MGKVKPSIRPKNPNKRKSALGNKGKSKGLRIKKQPGRTQKRGRRFQRKLKREPTGVVYISHIPHGFYEEQIEGYFSQFGKVTAVSVPRSKSGRAKGYAFIEYKYPEIAKIAADTMNNYLMCNRLLKAMYIPPEQQKPRLFRMAKAARENHQTAADKAELALKHNRKLKNRHLKLGLEVKLAAKLLKKKNSLIKRAEKLGLSHDFMVEEANLQSVFERKKEMEADKASKSNKQDLKSVKGEGTDSSEERLSSSESANDTESLESEYSISEDNEEDDFLSESEEENYKKIISKAKTAAKDILKKASKPTKLQKPSKGLVAVPVSHEPLSPRKKERLVGNENLPPNDILKSSNVSAKSKKLNTPSKLKSPSKGVIVADIRIEKNTPPKGSRGRKSLNKNVASLTEKTPSSVKKKKASVQKRTNTTLNVSQVVMEVDNNDEEINFKTPPNVVKKFIKTGKDSAKKTPKEKTANQSLLTPTKQNSSKKTPKEKVKSPKAISPSTLKLSPSGKKLRHRKLKHMLTTQ